MNQSLLRIATFLRGPIAGPCGISVFSAWDPKELAGLLGGIDKRGSLGIRIDSDCISVESFHTEERKSRDEPACYAGGEGGLY
jgi:hypothetical protein